MFNRKNARAFAPTTSSIAATAFSMALVTGLAVTDARAGVDAFTGDTSVPVVAIDIAPGLVGVKRTAQYSPEVERLIDRLKRQSDDGTLNSQDFLRIQRLHRRTMSEGSALIDVAQWHPEAEALKERLERQSDDGTLNSQDYRRVQRLHRELTS